MDIKATKPIWDVLRSLADKLQQQFANNPPVIKKLIIDPVDKPDGNHKRDFSVKIQYGKSVAMYKIDLAGGGDSSLELEHRDDCPWMDPQP